MHANDPPRSNMFQLFFYRAKAAPAANVHVQSEREEQSKIQKRITWLFLGRAGWNGFAYRFDIY